MQVALPTMACPPRDGCGHELAEPLIVELAMVSCTWSISQSWPLFLPSVDGMRSAVLIAWKRT